MLHMDYFGFREVGSRCHLALKVHLLRVYGHNGTWLATVPYRSLNAMIFEIRLIKGVFLWCDSPSSVGQYTYLWPYLGWEGGCMVIASVSAIYGGHLVSIVQHLWVTVQLADLWCATSFHPTDAHVAAVCCFKPSLLCSQFSLPEFQSSLGECWLLSFPLWSCDLPAPPPGLWFTVHQMTYLSPFSVYNLGCLTHDLLGNMAPFDISIALRPQFWVHIMRYWSV